MPEWRRDPILDRWVVVAPERSQRPSDFQVERSPRKSGRCPFCPGNEANTPPEVLAYGPPERTPDTPGWHVRVVPNKFPAIRDLPPDAGRRGPYRWMNGMGRHEIVIETPEHTADLDGQSPAQVAEVLRIWAERSRQLARDPRWRYVQVFKNVGHSGGASLEHSHSQIIALPFVPARLQRELAAFVRYRRDTGRCVLCEMVAWELADRQRLVYRHGGFVAFAPFASRFPGEVWITPRPHTSDYTTLNAGDRLALAQTLLGAIQALVKTFDRPPYNLVLHTVPVGAREADAYHWRLEILPRLSITAGFELGTGCYINPLPPEVAAGWLRDQKAYGKEKTNDPEQTGQHY